MPSTELAYITPQVVRWARDRVSMSLEQLAEELGVTPEQIKSWEHDVHPQFKTAQKLADALHIPFGYLFLSKPPVNDIPIPDLRTVGTRRVTKISPEFYEQLRSVLLKHEWYREFAQDEGYKPLHFVGKYSLDSSRHKVAEDIRNELSIDDELRTEAHNSDEFLRLVMLRAEDIGVLVMRSGIVGANTHARLSVDEFRGFAISDQYAPVVFINGRDSTAAQTFTLAHELAHIWIGESGISNPNFRKRSTEQTNTIEQFCNYVAAEVLVPRTSFEKQWQSNVSLDQNLQRLIRIYRVSSLVILRRALESNKLSESEYWKKFEEERARFEKKKEEDAEKKGGGDFYRTMPIRNSRRLTQTVVNALKERRIPLRDAAGLLSVKIPTLRKIVEHLG
jgi:Zn-dependent peptidase ImmA (M78 family)/transcriptional regulator with XRE-family HTH domain